MGYYTDYTLTWHPHDPLSDYQIRDILEDIGFELDDDDTYNMNRTWYQHDIDMLELSRNFPAILFTLHGAGEEPGDLWYKYYKHGKMQECCAKISYPPYNPEALT